MTDQDELLWKLIRASHILHKQGVVDAYGHVSVRNPKSPERFFMSRSVAPALVESVNDIIEFSVKDASPVNQGSGLWFAERFIHSEIYKRYPMVQAVVHSHCRDVLPFTVNSIPFRPLVHTTGFLHGQERIGAPLWDIGELYGNSGLPRDLLVKNCEHGAHLAKQFHPSQMEKEVITKSTASFDHPVVLMRGHGFTTCADTLEQVIFQAVYSREAAIVLTNSLLTMGAHWSYVGNSRHHPPTSMHQNNHLKYLSGQEGNDTARFVENTCLRSWELWIREVEVDPLYRCDIKPN